MAVNIVFVKVGEGHKSIEGRFSIDRASTTAGGFLVTYHITDHNQGDSITEGWRVCTEWAEARCFREIEADRLALYNARRRSQ